MMLTWSSTVVSDTLEKAAESTRKLLKSYCEMERRRPFTLNVDSWSKIGEESRIKCFGDTVTEEAFGSSKDNYSEERKVASDVLTYFKIASTRTIDVIPLFIEHEFLVKFSAKLQDTLVETLGIIGENGMEKCRRYAIDNPEISEARNDLKAKLEILVDATNILNRMLVS
jgi:hypothetical protein